MPVHRNVRQKIDRVADIPIHFIDEAEDWRVAQPRHIHQFDGAILYTFSAIDNHQG